MVKPHLLPVLCSLSPYYRKHSYFGLQQSADSGKVFPLHPHILCPKIESGNTSAPSIEQTPGLETEIPAALFAYIIASGTWHPWRILITKAAIKTSPAPERQETSTFSFGVKVSQLLVP